ncbi:MAG: efflux RND transporter permease subunit [Proteobacteria bacterium]|nr:efflux RND transporter permease subunit [Pseudomonadota bacterium]
MAPPVIFAIITTMVAFAPMLFIEGRLGAFVYAIPVIVISVIGISLFECLFVLPAHLAHSSPKPLGGPFIVVNRIRDASDRILQWTIRRPFQKTLELALKYRYFTASISSSILLISIGLVLGGVIPLSFFPSLESDEVRVTVELPVGYPAEETVKIVDKIQAAGIAMVKRFDEKAANGRKSLKHIRTEIRSQSRRNPSQSTAAYITMQFNEEKGRNLSTSEFGRMWQRSIRDFPEVESINFRARRFSFGTDIQILFSHEDSDKLTEIVEKAKLALAKYSGTKDIADSEKEGSREFRFALTSDARTLGITPTTFARALRSAYQGQEVFTLKKPQAEVPEVVLYPKKYRENVNVLETLNLRAPGGGRISLGEAARITEGVEPIAIRRVDKRRIIEVTAGVEDNAEDPEEIIRAFQRDFLDDLLIEYPSLTTKIKGKRMERTKTMNSLWLGFAAALLGVYALLAIFFTSYTQPFLVMSTIPFGIAGAVAGHWILGYPVTFISLFGLVGLTGVVVNDALILISTINRNMGSSVDLFEVLVASTKTRFRPIILTSITTFAGLVPILAETSRQAQFLIPMAISLGVGIMFATVITLILVPAFYLILEDIETLGRKIKNRLESAISSD